jgi:hypothetical protein
MKTKHKLSFNLIMLWAGLAVAHGAAVYNIQLNSAPYDDSIPAGDELMDSFGAELDGSFTAQLGVFSSSFTPDEFNTADWATNWEVFASDVIDDSPLENVPRFNLNADLNDDGTSTQNSGFDFSNQQAWLWVRNGDDIQVSGTEWFLARVASWVFPTVSSGCCGSLTSIDWAVSDLTTETPVWGNQSGEEGAGVVNNFSPTYELQTYAIPEPGSLIFMGLAGITSLAALRFRARRSSK